MVFIYTMLVLDVPVFLFQNVTFLNINISSYHYEYPNSIFLKVSNESHYSLFLPVYEFAATVVLFVRTLGLLYLISRDSFSTSISRNVPLWLDVSTCEDDLVGRYENRLNIGN